MDLNAGKDLFLVIATRLINRLNDQSSSAFHLFITGEYRVESMRRWVAYCGREKVGGTATQSI
jgi:hypothetical protein